MTFKQLTNELLLQGWRAYYIPDASLFTQHYRLRRLEVMHLLELQIYEGHNIVFVRTIHPPIEQKKPKYD